MPGRFRQSAEDFVVDEVPLRTPRGRGRQWLVRIEKRGIATFAAIEAIARHVGIPTQQCGYAGLKDRHAVARQWISIPAERDNEERLRSFEHEAIEVLEVAQHDQKLRLGNLRGNRFSLRVELDEAGDEATRAVRRNLDWLARHGVPNWFGEQRFGSGGRNLKKGLDLIAKGRSSKIKRMPKRLAKLIVASVQSEVFHHVLTERIEDFDRLEGGDLAWLHHNGAVFAVEDPRQEQVRADAFEISPTGPLPGPKMLRATGEQGQLEQDVFDALELQPEDFAELPVWAAPGARRPLRTRLTDPVCESAEGGLRLEFTLERGAFATTVLRQLLADQPWFDEQPGSRDADQPPVLPG